MATSRNETIMHFEKVVLLCIRTVYRSACYHPFVFSLVLFLLVFYISFPSLFAFLVSSSPVLVCTTLLLGLLLSYGEPNIPEIEGESKRTLKVPSVTAGNSSNHQYVLEDENLSIESHVENRNYNEKTQLRETILLKEKVTAREDISQASELHDGNKILHMIVETISSAEDQVQKENDAVEVIQEELHGRTISKDISKDRNIHAGGLGDGAEVDENTTHFYIADKQENHNLELDIDEPAADHHFDSSLGLPWLSVGGNHSSDSESDRAESSSPDASMADIIPMLHELHPLLNSEHPQHPSTSKSDAASQVSTLDHEIDDTSAYEEDEKDGEKKDGEALKGRDGAEAAVKWTEDDQKNVMDLGSSELERDRRLESLIAKRRARKNLTFRMDRNLIDLDTSDTFLTVYELSRFRVQVPARRNPFDSPYDSDEAMDLPPIPGSAPSSLLHRRNPFDLFYDQQEQDSDLTGETWGHQDLVSAPHREMLFKRTEAFGLGKREICQEKHHSRLKPYFVGEKIDSEVGISTFQRQFSDKSESKVSSIPESDAGSSAIDQDFAKQKYEIRQESELPSLAKHNADDGDRESRTSERESVDIEEEETGRLINSLVTDSYHTVKGSDQVVGDFGALKEDTGEKKNQNFPTSESEKLELIDQKHDDSNTSSSVEDHNVFEAFQQSSNLHEPEAVNNINDINFSLSSAKSREFDPIHVDVSSGLEGEEMVETKASSPSDVSILPDDSALSEFQKSPSVEKYCSSSHDIGVEETQVSTLELYSISEENQDDVEQKKDDTSYSNLDQIDHITGLPLHENLKFLGSDTAQQMPFFQKPRQEICHVDDTVKILHEPESSTSYISPVIPIQEYGLAGSQSVELSESRDSIASEMSEIRVHSICDLSRSIVDIKNPVLPKNEIGSTEMFDSSEEESDVVHNLVLENDGIDDNLPADIDGAVFFSPDLQNVDLMFQNDRQTEAITSTNRISYDHDYKFSENTSTQYADMLVNSSPSQLLEESLSSVVSESVSGNKSEASRLVLESTGIDISQANTNLTLPVSEARFWEDIYLAFKQISEESRPDAEASLVQEVDSGFNRLPEEAMVRTVSESGIDKPTLPKLVLESSEKDTTGSELSVVEARSLEDITAAFIQIREGTFDKHLHLDSGFRNSPGNAHLDAMLIQPDLHVVEAKSIEDIHEAFSQLSHNTTRKAPKEMDLNAHVLKASLVQGVDSGSNHLSEEAMAPSVSESDIKKPTQVKLLESNEKDLTDSELPVVEARSLENIREAFIQISEGTHDKLFHHDSSSVNSQGNAHLDVMLIQSDLHVVEAKSIEDIDKAFSQLSHNVTRKTPEKIDPNVHVLESLVQEIDSEFNEFPDETIFPNILESGFDKPAPLILVLESSEKDDTYSELPVVEARSLEDISAAFIQISEGTLSKPLHHDSGSQNSSSNAHMDSMLMQSDLHDVEAKSIEDTDEAFSQLSNRSTRKGPEKIDLNMHVLEASLVQEVDSGFNEFPEEAIVPSVSDSDVNKPTSQKLVLESSEKDSTDIELPLVEARCLEDIREAFLQTSEGNHHKPLHHDSGSQKSPGTVHLDAMLTQSDLHVVDAKSIEDINEAFRQLSHNKTRKASEQMEKTAETVKTGVL